MSELAAALRKFLRVEQGVTALLFEVRNAAGFSSNRSADAISMGLWPSRGLTLEGYEFKQSRQDFLSELKDPSKAESFARFCDHWWLLVSDNEIVKPGELPKNWGLIGYNKNKTALEVKVNAPKLEPEQVTRHFLAALIKSSLNPISLVDEAALKVEFERGKKEQENWQGHELRSAKKSLEELQKRVREFEAAAGFTITERWQGSDRVGRTVREVLDGKHRREEDRVENIYHSAKEIIKLIEERKLNEKPVVPGPNIEVTI